MWVRVKRRVVQPTAYRPSNCALCKRHTVREQTGLLSYLRIDNACALQGWKPRSINIMPLRTPDYPVPERRKKEILSCPKHERGLRGLNETGPGVQFCIGARSCRMVGRHRAPMSFGHNVIFRPLERFSLVGLVIRFPTVASIL